MPIRKHMDDSRPFGPGDLDAMGVAFTAALTKLGLTDRNDPMVKTVTRRIIRAALAGERDPIKLAEIGASGREPDK